MFLTSSLPSAGSAQIDKDYDLIRLVDMSYPAVGGKEYSVSPAVLGSAIGAAGMDIPGYPLETSASAEDYAVFYDVSASVHKKIFLTNLPQSLPANDYRLEIDGALASATEVGAFVIPRSGTIEAAYIYAKNPGTAGSTIINIKKNGSTIFASSANRPTLPFNDADKVAKSGSPSTTEVAENDVLTVDIDSAAEGAEDLSLLLSFTNTGGGASPAGYRDGRVSFRPPQLSDFSWVNGGSVIAVQEDYGVVLHTFNAGTTVQFRLLVKPLTMTPPYRVTAAARIATIHSNHNFIIPVGLRDSTTGRLQIHRFHVPNIQHAILNTTGPTNDTGAIFSHTQYSFNAPVFCRVHNDGTNLIWSYSHDGNYFVTMYTAGSSAWLANADQVFFGAERRSATYDQVSYFLHWHEEQL